MYDKGIRISGPCFAVFCLREPGLVGPKVGFTVPRALGKAVIRNRVKRRVRESVRLALAGLAPEWWVVLNPRRRALEAPFSSLVSEVERVFGRCAP